MSSILTDIESKFQEHQIDPQSGDPTTRQEKTAEELKYEQTFGYENLNEKIFRGENDWDEIQRYKKEFEDHKIEMERLENDFGDGSKLFEMENE